MYSSFTGLVKINILNGIRLVSGNIFTQNIDCGYTLKPAVLTSTHNLCFGAKIRKKIGMPVHTPVLLYKSGV